MKKTIARSALVTALALGASHGALADSRLSLTYLEPTGTVGAGETIDVWVRLANLGDEAFSFDLSDPVSFGLSWAQVPATGNNWDAQLIDVPFAEYDSAHLFVARNCSGSFTQGCAPGPYSADYVPTAGADWLDIGSSYSLDAGAYQDFRLYVLTPVGGVVAPGTYQLGDVSLGLNIEGRDAAGNKLEASLAFSTTSWDCTGGTAAGCLFVRTVSPVPEPAGWAMLTGGLLLTAGMARRRTGVAAKKGRDQTNAQHRS